MSYSVRPGSRPLTWEHIHVLDLYHLFHGVHIGHRCWIFMESKHKIEECPYMVLNCRTSWCSCIALVERPPGWNGFIETPRLSICYWSGTLVSSIYSGAPCWCRWVFLTQLLALFDESCPFPAGSWWEDAAYLSPPGHLSSGRSCSGEMLAF